MLAHGHTEARHYPVPMLWMETKLVTNRLNQDFATTALLTQMAVAGVLSKEAGKAFDKRIKTLTET